MIREMIGGAISFAKQATVRTLRTTANLLERADVGVGPFRLTPEGYKFTRTLFAQRFRELLEVPHRDDLASSIQADPTLGIQPTAALAALLRTAESGDGADAEEALRSRFDQLLERSRDLGSDEDVYPAFAVILDQLSPDEARVLRRFSTAGPQPVVDVVASPLIGKSDTLMAEHLSLIGDRAGCTYPDRAPTYLVNLERLGLVTIDRTELVGDEDYELIEVGPRASEVEDRIEDKRRQRTRFVRKTARLSPLGETFCDLVIEDDT